jgi:two-component system aerobic respiration control sensor histidine kinase ArcB
MSVSANQGNSADSEQHRALSKLKCDLFYLKSIINKLPGSIYWKDKDGVYLGCNEFVLQMAGGHKVIGKTDFDLPWKGHAKHIRNVDIQVIETGHTIELEENPILANGQQIIMLTRKAPLFNEEGAIVGVMGISVDITDRKRLEIALNEAKEKAEAANKAKTEFLENMRHDIRTPLTGITGFANIISAEVDNPKIKEYANNLTASSHALLDLLNEILEIIKVNSGDIPLLKRKFDLKGRLLDVINLNKAKAKQKGIHLIFNHDEKIPSYVIGDYTRVHRIVLELITNALNFTDKGTVSLTSTLAREDSHNIIITMVIEDTGIGIAPEQQNEIYLQFMRLTPSYEGIYKGAGLGLAVVKRFVNDLGGEIYVDSQVGVGTKFTLILPFKKPLLEGPIGLDEAPLASSKTREIQTEINPSEETKSKEKASTKSNILVVEDQAMAAMVVKRILLSLECEVDVAPDGEKAILLTQNNHYDLIFMDIGLPEIDGYETTRRIRLFELNKDLHTPIIALTAHVDEESRQRCLEVGMNAVISKPLAKEKAIDILNAFIPRREQGAKGMLPAFDKEGLLKIEGKPIDVEVVSQLLDSKTELIGKMLEMFSSSLSAEVKHLDDAYDKKDWQAIQVIAHKLRGDASYCGAIRLKHACSRMDDAVRLQAHEFFIDLYHQMLREIKSFQDSVKNKNH